MDERKQFERYSQSLIAKIVERIQTMTESQVVHQLRSMKAVRNTTNSTLDFLNSASLASAEDSEDEISKLKSDLSSYPHPTVSPFLVSDYIEDALKKRLETLRRGLGRDS